VSVPYDQVVQFVRTFAKVVSENREYLTGLDSAIGDADHGINMDRGMSAALTKLDDVPEGDVGNLFKTVGMTLVSTVGGAGGPLYGTLFMQMGMAVAGKPELSSQDWAEALTKGLEGVVMRGKAELGDKTMVDALAPAVDALREAIAAGDPLDVGLARAREAAEEGMRATTPMLARKGRASYLGERSIGHQDPGATSVALIVAALERAVATGG
jgi:dihydroxyacetone kinase-like protein